MPPSNLRFPVPPTQVHDATLHEVRKIAKAHVKILYVDPQFLDFIQLMGDILERSNIMGSRTAPSAELGFGARFLDFWLRPNEDGLAASDGRQMFFQLGDELIRFRKTKNSVQGRSLLIFQSGSCICLLMSSSFCLT